VKRSKYTEEQIAFALKQAELGTAVPEVCRKMGVSEATFYNWKKKFGGLGPSELRRLRQLEEECNRLMLLDRVRMDCLPYGRKKTLPQQGSGFHLASCLKCRRTQTKNYFRHTGIDQP